MSKSSLSTQPYRGARDWYPEEIRLRNYIFDTWRQVCRSYGFEEYDFPILESWEIFAAKSGEEIVNNQLFSFEDQGGRKLAIRPELTPGTVRMLAQKYGELIKPVKWFMIGNNWRYEKPQKGRGREFYQLEANTFGVPNVEADFEIFTLMIEIMRAFGASENMFQISYNDRRLIQALLKDYLRLSENKSIGVRRLMDKRLKMKKAKFLGGLTELGLNEKQVAEIEAFMQSVITPRTGGSSSLDSIIPKQVLDKNEGYKSVLQLIKLLDQADLSRYCKFDPSIVRGFDYSDGLVYEVFDLQPDNNRSMFGGERFDKLIKIFGDKYDLTATGFGMGDYTLIEFLNAWKLVPEFDHEVMVMVTVFSLELLKNSWNVALQLRKAKINTLLYPDSTAPLPRQLRYAHKKNIPWVVVVGPDEVRAGKVSLKNMESGKQKTVEMDRLVDRLRSNAE